MPALRHPLTVYVDGAHRGQITVPADLSIGNTLPLRIGGPNFNTRSDMYHGSSTTSTPTRLTRTARRRPRVPGRPEVRVTLRAGRVARGAAGAAAVLVAGVR